MQLLPQNDRGIQTRRLRRDFGDCRILQKVEESISIDPNEGFVVPTLKEDLFATFEARIDDRLKTIGSPDRRNGANGTIREELHHLQLAAEMQRTPEFVPHPIEFKPVGSRQHRKNEASVVLEDDRLRDAVFIDVCAMRGRQTAGRPTMVLHTEVDFVTIQKVFDPMSERHFTFLRAGGQQADGLHDSPIEPKSAHAPDRDGNRSTIPPSELVGLVRSVPAAKTFLGADGGSVRSLNERIGWRLAESQPAHVQ